MTDISTLRGQLEALPHYQPQDVAKEFNPSTIRPKLASPLVGSWREERSVLKWSDVAALLAALPAQPSKAKSWADNEPSAELLDNGEAIFYSPAFQVEPPATGTARSGYQRALKGEEKLLIRASMLKAALPASPPPNEKQDDHARVDTPGSPVDSLTALEDGRLFDLLDEAATLIDEGLVADSETLKCIYREAIHEAIKRLRTQPAALPDVPHDAQARWQPIETAPKDGTWMLVSGCNGSPLVLVAAYREEHQAWRYPGRWVSYGDVTVKPPTHWMPLPASPSAQRTPND